MQSVLDHFDSLRKPTKVKHACFKLIKHLEVSQKSCDEEGELSQEMKYALKRLIRGMGSADQGTVVGFTACFASLLKFHSDLIKYSTIQEYIESELELKSSLLRGEEGMVTYGRILVYGSVIRSKIFQSLSEEDKSFILDQLLVFCYKRAYISASVYYYTEQFLKLTNFDKKYVKIVMSHLLNNKFHMNIDTLHLLLTLQNCQLPTLTSSQNKFAITSSIPNTRQPETMSEFVQILIDIRSSDDLNMNVYLRFANNMIHVYKNSNELIKSFWNHIETNVLTQKDLTLNKKLAIFKIFSTFMLHCESTKQILNFFTPNFLHTVMKSCSEIPSDLVASISPMIVLVQKFTNKIVLKRTSDKYGFESIEHGSHIIKSDDADDEESDKESDDDEDEEEEDDDDDDDDDVADGFRIDEEDIYKMINIIITDSYLINIEKVTRSKILQTLINTLNKNNVKKLSKLYKKIINEEISVGDTKINKKGGTNKNKDKNSVVETKAYHNKDKIYILNLLTKLIFHPVFNEHKNSKENDTEVVVNKDDATWRYEQMEFIFNIAMMGTESGSDITSSHINHELANGYKKTLFTLLGHNLNHNLLEKLVQHANDIVQSKHYKNIKMSPAVLNCWKQSLEMIAKLNNKLSKRTRKSNQNKSILIAFQTMYLELCLYLLIDNSISIDVLEELKSCYDRFDEKKNDTSEENEPHWIEVITELFLTLLSKDSILLRHLVSKVFKLLVPVINVQAVHQILQVLDPTGNNPLKSKLENDDDDDDETDESGDDESVDEEEEEDESSSLTSEETPNKLNGNHNGNGISGDASETEEEEEEEESDIDEEYLGNETITDKLRQAVNQALGMNGNITDAESVDISDMEETEGKQLDMALSKAFLTIKKPNSKLNKKQSRAEQSLTNFRIRVLDLIEILTETHSNLNISLDILSTLFVLLRYALKNIQLKSLENKIRNVLKHYSNLRKNNKGSNKNNINDNKNINDELFTDILNNSILEKGNGTSSTQISIGSEISTAIIFLVRAHCSIETSMTCEELKESKFMKCIFDLLDSFFTKRHCAVSHFFFKNLCSISWLGNAHILSTLPTYAFNKQLRYFNRANALNCISVLLRNKYFIEAASADKAYMKLVEETLTKFITNVCDFLADSEDFGKATPSFIANICESILLIKARPDVIRSKKLDVIKKTLDSLPTPYFNLRRLFAAFDLEKQLVHKGKSQQNNQDHESKTNDESDEEEENSEEEEEDETDDDDDEEENGNKKKRKKHRNSKSKTKKKTKLLRMNDLSKGIEEIGGFDKLHVEETNDKVIERKKTKKNKDKTNGTDETTTNGNNKKIKKIKENGNHNEDMEEDNDDETDNENEIKEKVKKNKKKLIKENGDGQEEEKNMNGDESNNLENGGGEKKKKRKRKHGAEGSGVELKQKKRAEVFRQKKMNVNRK